LDDPLSKYAYGYTICKLWFVKVDATSGESVAESSAVSPTVQPSYTVSSASVSATTPPRTSLEIGPTSVSCTTLVPLQIPNLANTCYFNTLVQSIFWVVPLRKALMDYKTSKIDKGIQPIFLLGEEVTSKNCLDCLKQLKTLLSKMKENITRLNKHKLKKDMIKILGYLGLSHFDSKCVNKSGTSFYRHILNILNVMLFILLKYQQ
jgi:hypothetical protein